MGRRSRRDDATPPRKGLSLGLLLALSTAVIVTVVMGAVTLVQRLSEIDHERRAHEELLEQSLAPLVDRIRRCRDHAEMRAELHAFHEAYVLSGRTGHHLELADATGEVFSTHAPSDPVASPTFRASVPVTAPGAEGFRGTLTVWEDASGFEAAVDRGWGAWWLHMAVTVGSILAFLFLAIRILVTRPLLRLLEGVRKMEMGYWGDVAISGGAWEIRWLCWRFRNMGIELQRTVQHLVAAERRASELVAARSDGRRSASAGGADAAAALEPGATAPVGPEFGERLRALEALEPGDPRARALAQDAWDRLAADADRVGNHEVKAGLENAALRILEPAGYRELAEALAGLEHSLAEWVRLRQAEIRSALETALVPSASIRHRVKHIAGVWRKMRSKGLGLEQVHDLIAFRVVVPTEPDCYSALGVIHRTFEPVVGRFKDYIAAPKASGYESLHTCLRSPDGRVFEIQIRSVAMDEQAEWGSAAHWTYKHQQRGEEARLPRARGIRAWIRSIRQRGGRPGAPGPLMT